MARSPEYRICGDAVAEDEGVPVRDLTFWYILFCVASVGMQLMNKAIATSFRSVGVASLDNLVMAAQQAMAVGLNFLCVWLIGGETWRYRPVTYAQVRRLIIPTINFVLMLLCSLKALKTVHVATVVVARNLCTVFICFGEYFVFGSVVSPHAKNSMAFIVLGSFVYGFADLNFEATGYFWQSLNSVLFIVGQLVEKWAMGRSTDQTPLGISTIKNSMSIPVLLSLHWMSEADPFMAITDAGKLPFVTWVLVIMTGVGCCGLSICYMMLHKISSATAMSVGNNFNKVVSIILGAIIFRSALGGVQILGLLICMGGSLLFSVSSISDARKKSKDSGSKKAT